MPNQPPVHEREFIKLSKNHQELASKLNVMGVPAPVLLDYAKFVCKRWFLLAEEHLNEARAALLSAHSRTTFSRAYYASYNVSKAMRYLVNGEVSLKGDDHGKASADLPNDLPDVAHWAEEITRLYEHRLFADYDNWIDTQANMKLNPHDATEIATQFIEHARDYINNKFGAFL